MKTKTPKDPTGAERQRRYKERRKQALAAVSEPLPPLPSAVTEPVIAVATPTVEVLPPRPRPWSAFGRAAVGLAIAGTGAFVAFTSIRANSWFGHSLTTDLPTGCMFYLRSGERFTALRGWLLMAVVLVVVFFAAGGFAVTNLNAGVEARAERSTAETTLAQRRLDTVTKSRLAECARRGDRCRKLEAEEQDAIAALGQAQASVRVEADPQAAALGISTTHLHLVQAGSMVALCLFSGLFISFGAGLIWPKN